MQKNILNYNSVENIPHINAKAAFTVNSASVFREENNIVPIVIDDKLSYMPWGGDQNCTPRMFSRTKRSLAVTGGNMEANIINLTFPKSWGELTDKELLFVFTLLAYGYPATDIKVKCLLKFF